MTLARRIALALLALAAAMPAAASVTTADRSPFVQGHWWEPARSGSGFDIFSAAGNVGVVWFTYDESGKPVWYTAVGSLASLGTQSWPLMKHRWTGGRKQDPATVGWLMLTKRNPQLIDVAWSVSGRTGNATIEPLVVSGIVDEIDHSGHWFDPGNGGWGFSLQEQGEVLGGALFTYDLAGEPTWVSGYARNSTTVDYSSFNGSCPWCAYRAPQASPAGRLAFDFAGESELTVRNGLSLAMAPGVNVDGARVVQLARPASTRPADRQLASFAGDASLKSYLADGLMNIPRLMTGGGGGGFSSPPPSVPFSPTNLQEPGVDEADIVKSDGLYVYTFLHDDHGSRKPSIRVARVDSEGAALAVVGEVPLASGPDTPVANAGLYLHSGKLVSLASSRPFTYVSPWAIPAAWAQGSTFVEVMDSTRSVLPATRWRARIDGMLVSSRRVGSRLYVVSRFVPWIPGFQYGADYEPYYTSNVRLIAQTAVSDLLPQVRIDNGAPAPLVASSSVLAPPQGAQPPMADMIVLTAIDLDALRVVQSLAIVGTAQAIYASASNLFVATSRYASIGTGVASPIQAPVYLTDVHQVGLGADTMTVVGSASVEGFLDHDADKASFRLSDYQGRLRVVTSSTRMWGGANQNRVTVLEPSKVAPGTLRTLSYLPNARRPESLGKPNELLYGTRFVGDRLYAVTFKSIDPLYVVDLGDSTDPRIAGALEVPGFSEYLHPLPNGVLLGFGKDARPATEVGDGQFAWYQGLQLSLYDVRDLGKPREIQRVVAGRRGSDSALLRDHHAFGALMQPDGTGTFAIPVRIADGAAPASGTGDSAFYAWQWSGLMRFALQGTTAADARLVPLANLVSHKPTAADAVNSNDPAKTTGRSVLFRNGSVYVGNGLFWRQDAGGNVSGPF